MADQKPTEHKGQRVMTPAGRTAASPEASQPTGFAPNRLQVANGSLPSKNNTTKRRRGEQLEFWREISVGGHVIWLPTEPALAGAVDQKRDDR